MTLEKPAMARLGLWHLRILLPRLGESLPAGPLHWLSDQRRIFARNDRGCSLRVQGGDPRRPVSSYGGLEWPESRLAVIGNQFAAESLQAGSFFAQPLHQPADATLFPGKIVHGPIASPGLP